jgi:hypothetical protein
LTSLFKISSISLLLKSFVVEMLTFGGDMLLFFLITCVSMLGVTHLRPSHWLKGLITCSLSVEKVSMFRQDSEVAWLRCYFWPLE